MDGRGGSFVAVRRITQDHSHTAEIVAGSGAWIGKGFSCVCVQGSDSDPRLSFDLTPSQEALKELWNASFPEEELSDLVSDQWKEMGWQGKDPATDFRGGGFISLENLLFFAKMFPKSYQDLLQKQEGNRAMWEYPFAVAGVNITFMLIQMLDLEAVKPRTMTGVVFLKLLEENDDAFDILYCITFKLMDQQWLAMNASYMDFNTVMKSTQHELEKQLLLLEDITRIEDMPYFSLLQ
ncbi:ELMO domain-containing protein A-like isoform X3 [Papaver somniferum]|uniref:ELMO domain-containing protein A-like isoform X3 n=1 Tax=Papaver somniferum TaxID=3469 RepID=UPI000E703BD4|nr:ELMO domain-containing protein A-like isoform X3 [Papaver somniferum]